MTKHYASLIAALSLIALGSSSANANEVHVASDDDPIEERGETHSERMKKIVDQSTRFLSLTMSPLHLVLADGMIEGTAELKLGPRGGGSFVFGRGSVDGSTVTELGAQLKLYQKSFDGGLLGGVEFLSAKTDIESSSSVAAFGGYKAVSKGGFTLDVALGVQLVESEVLPMANINVGISL